MLHSLTCISASHNRKPVCSELQPRSGRGPCPGISSNITMDQAGSGLRATASTRRCALISHGHHQVCSVQCKLRDSSRMSGRKQSGRCSGYRRRAGKRGRRAVKHSFLSLPCQPLCPPDPVQGREHVPTSGAGTSLHDGKRDKAIIV